MKNVILKVYLFVLFIILFLLSALNVFAQSVIQFNPVFRANWPHIDRPKTYDYAATGIIDDNGNWDVWFCGGGDRPGDFIFYWRLTSNSTFGPTLALPNSGSDDKEDGMHSCAPTVFKHRHPHILDGREIYKMYYECARRFYGKNSGKPVEGFTQICHAVSFDGRNWQKYNESLWNSQHRYGDLNTPPTAVVKVGQRILEQCDYHFSSGKHLINDNCLSDMANYGVGHPSAIVREVNGGQQIWLYYFDSEGQYPGRVYLTKSWDGFNFDSPIATNLTRNVDIKYFAVPVGSYPGYFIATQGLYDDNYFAYSFDGINWVWYDNVGDKSLLRIGKAVESHQIAYAQPSILGNKFGVLNTTFANILSGEGKRDANWYQNSGLWLIQGNFEVANNYLLGDLDGNKKVDIFDYNILVSNFGKSGSPGWIPADINKDGKVDIFDYNILVGNFGVGS